ncbi:hypothetical protein RhiirA1_457513 [Rhizophagus irregularis]|uniref:Uncharacterized protein n=1 Tax=Rhizophagus irregularis TaxID=588596 RepID=A0A2I1EP01_9GLOM|nr:hypothetical protein RhiirA1_457513 [Rhizophagus irregularis]PKY23860.1 hypothetical protein RhiirB3_438204 [Rhizophagus irregularis]CAB4476859.1 unnamed protein product [Rhizophagus irregularis]CAB5384384.1 unnamed protein product [Rhizophagus irregularis]
MNSNVINIIPNKCTMYNYSTENDFAINKNNQPNFRRISDVGMSNINQNNFHIDSVTSESEKTFELYLALPNDTILIYVTYTELNPIEIAQRLNNNINLSHIPDHQFQHHYYLQNLIKGQIIQKSQQNCNFYNCIQQDTMRHYDAYITDIKNSSGNEVLLQQQNNQLYQQ